MPKYLIRHGSIRVGAGTDEKAFAGPGSTVELTEAQAARTNEGFDADSPKGLAVVLAPAAPVKSTETKHETKPTEPKHETKGGGK